MHIAIAFERVRETYEAREVERVAGVSVDRQKDWRRHKLTSPHIGSGRVRTNIDDLLLLAFLSLITKGINNLDVAKSIAEAAGEAAMQEIESIPGMVRYELDDGAAWNPSGAEIAAIKKAVYEPTFTGSKYAFVPLPYVQGSTTAYLLLNLQEFDQKSSGYAMGLFINIAEVVSQIASRLDGPIVTYRKVDIDKPQGDHPFYVRRLDM